MVCARMRLKGITGKPLKLWPDLLDHYIKPLLPALAIPILAVSPEAVTAVATVATVLGLEIAEDYIKEFFGIEDQKTNVMETPVVDINPEDVNLGGSEIADQSIDSMTTPIHDDPVDQLLENIPEGLDNNSTELPVQDDLGLGLNEEAPAKRDTGTTVLGSYPEYVELSDELGARRYQIPEDTWSNMTDTERWDANQKFLDRTISRGDEVILSNSGHDVRTGSYLAQEIEYMKSEGYSLSSDGLRLSPPGIRP